MDAKLRQEIEARLELPQEMLLLELAGAAGLGASPPTPSDGQAIFRNWSRKVQAEVCRDPEVRRLHGVLGHKRMELACVIAECLIQKFTGIPAATIAILLMREGLAGFCSVHWGQSA